MVSKYPHCTLTAFSVEILPSSTSQKHTKAGQPAVLGLCYVTWLMMGSLPPNPG